MRKAKIVCTIGPASDSREIIEQLIQAGMNVARLNFSHGSHEEKGKTIRLLQQIREELHVPLAILLDTKGPEIRLGLFKNGREELMTGAKFMLTARDIEGDADGVSISYKDLPYDVHPGDRILLDDGLIELKVSHIEKDDIHCAVINGGVIKDRKGVNLPGTRINLPAVSEQDRKDIEFGCTLGVDYIAASFIQDPEDVLTIRAILAQCGADDTRIIAKIENRRGVDNFQEIINVADGAMVARGDLGVEIPIEDVPMIQKKLIHICNMTGKPVITATQMLESMIQNPRPTRAEANDVANSILDGTDAVMLSGETAAGSFPVEAVRTMDRIAKNIQAPPITAGPMTTITAAVSHACCDIAQDLGAKAIITPTKSGMTAGLVARFRPDCPIIACAMSESSFHKLALNWGVIPLMLPEISSTDELFEQCVAVVEKEGILTSGDIAVVTAGVPLSMAGTTNLIHVQIVGNVLLRGTGVGAKSAFGCARLANTPDFAAHFSQGDILVAKSTDSNLLPFMKRAGALVVEDADSLGHAAVVGVALDIPVLLSADGALTRIHDGLYITVDAASGLVYKGKRE